MTSAGALRTEGNELFRSKQYFEAYRCYQSALNKCSPKDKNQMANIYVCLSKTELILEKIEEAITSATKAIEIDPSNYQGYLRRGNAYCETLQFERALEDYQHALELEPSDSFLKQRIELARSSTTSSKMLSSTKDVSTRTLATQRQDLSTQNQRQNSSYTRSRYDRQEGNRYDRPNTNQSQFNDKQTTNRYDRQETNRYDRQTTNRYNRQETNRYDRQETNRYDRQTTNRYDRQTTNRYDRQNATQSQFNDREDTNQRQFNDTLRPHSIPDPKPMDRTNAVDSPSSPQSNSYSSTAIIQMMKKMLQDVRPSASEVLQMIEDVKQIITPLPNIVDIDVKNATFHVVGDTHGQYQDVLNLFEEQGYPSSTNPYLFNGDFVDRGSMGVEILIALMAWKLFDPSCIYFNRGNHETRAMNAMYGFERECTSKYNRNVYEAFDEFFNALQIGHILNKQVLIVHGGLSDSNMSIQRVNNENRFQQPSEDSIINDILWSDPMDSRGMAPSPRGCTHQFGPDVTQNVLQLNSLSYLIRSHQVQENGYLLQHNRKCITVFSAPNYIGSMYNKGAICNFTFGAGGEIVTGPQFITFAAEPIPRNYPPMKFSLFGGMF